MLPLLFNKYASSVSYQRVTVMPNEEFDSI